MACQYFSFVLLSIWLVLLFSWLFLCQHCILVPIRLCCLSIVWEWRFFPELWQRSCLFQKRTMHPMLHRLCTDIGLCENCGTVCSCFACSGRFVRFIFVSFSSCHYPPICDGNRFLLLLIVCASSCKRVNNEVIW